ncbi:MAG: WD40/YVTN/BNR-like repeat-containing protein [Candidatus Dormibacterales bacterium]
MAAASMIAIAGAWFAYLHPAPTVSRAPAAVHVEAPQSTFQPAALAFVSPTRGWVVALSATGAYTLLQTADAGQTWSRALTGQTGGRGVYLRFFDSTNGVFALTGAKAETFWTYDGGRTWTAHQLLDPASFVVSLYFVDSTHGWLLVRTETPTTASSDLLRTTDGGANWTSLGQPVPSADDAYSVEFSDRNDGWLESLNSGAYAYRSLDGGASWQPVALPAPQGGWPPNGQFFVAAYPTKGLGVVATVANFAPISGRSGIGASVLLYPPLTVRAYDGGLPVRYIYTFAPAFFGGDPAQAGLSSSNTSGVPAPNQVSLGSLDGGLTWGGIAPPAAPGAIGYSDARNWWWIGSAVWSKSSDGGGTWSPYRNVGVITPLAGTLQLLDDHHAWYGAMAGSRAVLETTSDGGVHWRMVLLPG